MSWGPKNWDEVAWNFAKGSPECRAYYEAGADAMLYAILEALLDRKIKFKRSRGVVELIVEKEDEMP